MSVTKLKDERWIVQYQVAGKIKREYFGRGVEAESKARHRQSEISLKNIAVARGAAGGGGGLLFGDLCQDYFNTKKSSAMTESTANRLGLKLDRRIIPKLGLIDASAITSEVLDRYVDMRAQEGVKMITIHGELTFIRAILRWGVRRKRLSFYPAEGFEFPTRDGDVIDPPTVEELTSIWSVAAPHLKKIIALQFFLGCRPGEEVLSLRWEAVDFAEGYITVVSAKKGGLRSRRVLLHPILAAWMREWWEVDNERGQVYIVNFRGKRIHNPSSAWKEAKRKAGISRGRRLRLYDIRHFFGSALITNGEDPKTVSKIMGHSNVQTTLAVYTHSTREAQERAIGRLPVIGYGGLLPDGIK